MGGQHHESHLEYDQDSFYEAFVNDLRKARGLVIIQSPYLRVRRVNALREEVNETIHRRVRICVLVRRRYIPAEDPNADAEKQFIRAEAIKAAKETEDARQILMGLGAHVTYRTKIHEKLVVMDEEIAWTGSLNIFSQRDTSEAMTRWHSRKMVDYLIENHELDSCASCPKRLLGAPVGFVEDDLRSIGREIERRRKSLKMNQIDLYSLARLSQGNLSRIERGMGNSTLVTLSQICRVLRSEVRIIPRFLLSTVDALLASAFEEPTSGLKSDEPPSETTLSA